MGKFEMCKHTDERGYNTFYFKDSDNKKLIITFCGNLDLYFCLSNFNNKPYFIIDRENYLIYELFDKLYNDIKNCNLFDKEDNNYKNRYEYKHLFNNNVIEWRCDDYPYDIAPYFTIIKKEDSFIINFKQHTSFENIDDINYLYFPTKNRISIRLRNSGSRYTPFNIIFMRLYHSLCDLNEFDFEQFHIEEYLFKKKKLIK